MRPINANGKSKLTKTTPTQATLPAVPQNSGAAIPSNVVKETVDIALTKKDGIAAKAQTNLTDEAKRNAKAAQIAKKHAAEENARLNARMSSGEKASHERFLAAKQAHREQAGEEERKRMQAEKQAPEKAGSISVQVVDIAKEIQPNISERAAAANNAREQRIAAEEAIAKQHGEQEKQRRARIEAEKKAKLERTASNALSFLPKPIQPAKAVKKVTIVEKQNLPIAEVPAPIPKEPVLPASAIKLESPAAPPASPEPQAKEKRPLTRRRKAIALVEELKIKETANRQQALAKAEQSRQEIARQARHAIYRERAALVGTSLVSGIALWFGGAGTTLLPLLAKIGIVLPGAVAASVPFAVGCLLGVGLYYAGKFLATKCYDIYRSFKYSDKQRYDNDLNYEIKVNASLERQFDPVLQKEMINRLDYLAANAADPKFNDKDALVSQPDYSKLTVVQYENHKLLKRANKTQAECVKWDEKFLNQDENSIYLKVAKKK